MSRIAKAPIPVPKGVEVSVTEAQITAKGPKGQLDLVMPSQVRVEQADSELKIQVKTDNKQTMALAGTIRSLVNNMVTGVSEGFEKKLTVIGVGYRAQIQGKKLNLTLGFSHPVVYQVPEGITVGLTVGMRNIRVSLAKMWLQGWMHPQFRAKLTRVSLRES